MIFMDSAVIWRRIYFKFIHLTERTLCKNVLPIGTGDLKEMARDGGMNIAATLSNTR